MNTRSKPSSGTGCDTITMEGCMICMKQKAAYYPVRVFSSILPILSILLLAALTAPQAGTRSNHAGSTVAGLRPLVPHSHAESVSAYEIVSPSVLLSGYYADGRLHDFMLENDRIAVVIGAISHPVHYALSGGNVIDAGSSSDRIDALREFYTYFDDDWPRQAVYDSLRIADDGSTGGPAVIRVSGVDSAEPSLKVVTDYSLAAYADHVAVTTALTNTGSADIRDFELGDCFTWGGCRKFAPWYGFDMDGETTAGPWLAGTAASVTYGYAGLHGDIWGHHGNYWSDMNVSTMTLGSGDTISFGRNLVVGGSDIASAAALIHEIMGNPVGSVQCSVRDEATGLPISGAVIDAYNESGQIYLQMETGAGGSAGTTLPPGTWRLAAAAERYGTRETWLAVENGSFVSCDFLLPPDSSLKNIKLYRPVGDTLTVIQRPLVNIPALVEEGDTLVIDCDADPAAAGWAAMLKRENIEIPLDVVDSSYDPSTLWWRVSCLVPPVPLYELYDLRVTADGGIEDVTRNAVKVITGFREDYYFIHITDTHLPTHKYHNVPGSENDTSEVADLREVMADIDLINPEFVLLTGDFVNEGELEEYLNWRVFTRGQKILSEFPVPVYLTAGNHDIGGWDDTPPPDGTARRDWWRFFGWKRLDDPPPGAPWHTQNYSFDYGPVHYVGLEAYDNYDGWRYGIYGGESFTSGQLEWLDEDLAAASGSAAQVLFYHYDFRQELDLDGLGVEGALWGHIHRDEGSIYRRPFDLATDAVCGGKRFYRLIYVSGGSILQPAETLSAGFAGQNLTVEFTPGNNGLFDDVTAEIINSQDQRFENGLLKFVMPGGYGGEVVTGGTLMQVDDSGDFAIYYVNVDIIELSVVTVNLRLVP